MLESNRKFANKPLCPGGQRSKSLSGINCRVYVNHRRKIVFGPSGRMTAAPKTGNNRSGKPERHWKDKLRESDNDMCEVSVDVDIFCCPDCSKFF